MSTAKGRYDRLKGVDSFTIKEYFELYPERNNILEQINIRIILFIATFNRDLIKKDGRYYDG